MMSKMAQGGGMPGMPGMPGMGGGPGRQKKQVKQAKGKRKSGNPMKRKAEEQAAAARREQAGRRAARSGCRPASRARTSSCRTSSRSSWADTGRESPHRAGAGSARCGPMGPAPRGRPVRRASRSRSTRSGCTPHHGTRDQVPEHVRHPHRARPAADTDAAPPRSPSPPAPVRRPYRRVEQPRRQQPAHRAVHVRVAERAGHPPEPSGRSPARLGDVLQVVPARGRQRRRCAARVASSRPPPAAPPDVAHRSGGPQPASTTAPPRSASADGRRQRRYEPVGVAGRAADRLERGDQVVRRPRRIGRRRRRRRRSTLDVPARRAPAVAEPAAPAPARAARGPCRTPVTRAPRAAAISSASPEPQPRPSSRVPAPTSSRSYTAS